MQTILIKYGGHALDVPQLRDAFISDMKKLARDDFRFVIVHGGGPQINRLLAALNIQSSFVRGLRVTDAPTLEAVEMALCGQVNKFITRLLASEGLPAAGISGEDGGLFLARQMDASLGLVGEITAVNPRLPLCLLDNNFLPVIAPLALDDAGNPLNVNADTAAGSLAGALKAAYFVLVSDVAGVLDKDGRLVPELAEAEVSGLIADGTIYGGMLPKIAACLTALGSGCGNALLLNGKEPDSLARYLVKNEPLGTIIRK